eukprot:6622033-Prymnesium_polylepis.1
MVRLDAECVSSLQCASQLYSTIPLVGKLDDDTYLYADGMAALLRSTLPWLDRPWMAYVGPMEAFSWNEHTALPVRWAGVQATAAPCTAGSLHGERVAGPFSFAKGAAFFVSTALAHLLAGPNLSDSSDPRRLPGSVKYWPSEPRGHDGSEEHATSTVKGNASTITSVAWEDVWLGCAPCFAPGCDCESTGRIVGEVPADDPHPFGGCARRYALSHLAAARDVAIIHLPADMYQDAWGFFSKPTALFWHSRVDDDLPRRMRAVHNWTLQHSCGDTSYRLACRRTSKT